MIRLFDLKNVTENFAKTLISDIHTFNRKHKRSIYLKGSKLVSLEYVCIKFKVILDIGFM